MNDALANLPLFATDREIAIAVVGKERASYYTKAVIPMLERQGFPLRDPLHDGRPVPLVARFYSQYWGIGSGTAIGGPDGKEDWSAWDNTKRRSAKKKPQLGLDTRSQNALVFMAEHPDVRSHLAVPNASTHTMNVLVEKGALRPGKKDQDGDPTWVVTEAGKDEARRLAEYYGGKSRP
ncbi:hypothetical protein [Aliirhizobium cellulosilyticum]|uniref:Uncharacterized protein n=1 Tax=Aliirhizobium cellulosilyticum TaxID=393664 RepID=A0A7W6XZ45_9HYPH|nr:hypothetical protein [Rhizobium cellulosilyticum]MBB4348032.1 hypothetical protein [Rhizobium cellulosilyticum]MBB4409574.1 hypothetical protein [Rhizobium cellulosilyticum]MBB4444263.1 hypothetical protein [Rhizobium cellulosilyticum]